MDYVAIIHPISDWQSPSALRYAKDPLQWVMPHDHDRSHSAESDACVRGIAMSESSPNPDKMEAPKS